MVLCKTTAARLPVNQSRCGHCNRWMRCWVFQTCKGTLSAWIHTSAGCHSCLRITVELKGNWAAGEGGLWWSVNKAACCENKAPDKHLHQASQGCSVFSFYFPQWIWISCDCTLKQFLVRRWKAFLLQCNCGLGDFWLFDGAKLESGCPDDVKEVYVKSSCQCLL